MSEAPCSQVEWGGVPDECFSAEGIGGGAAAATAGQSSSRSAVRMELVAELDALAARPCDTRSRTSPKASMQLTICCLRDGHVRTLAGTTCSSGWPTPRAARWGRRR